MSNMNPRRRKAILSLTFAIFLLILNQQFHFIHQQQILHQVRWIFLVEQYRILAMLSLLLLNRRRRLTRRQQRLVWKWSRPQEWFNHLRRNAALGPLWTLHFRVSRRSFVSLCRLLQRDLMKQDTKMQEAFSVETRNLLFILPEAFLRARKWVFQESINARFSCWFSQSACFLFIDFPLDLSLEPCS